jgi:hypothetical protein
VRTAARVAVLLVVGLAPSVAATSCSTPLVCEPGRYIVCDCPAPPGPDGSPMCNYISTQSCNEAGTSFDDCECEAGAWPCDAGSDAR